MPSSTIRTADEQNVSRADTSRYHENNQIYCIAAADPGIDRVSEPPNRVTVLSLDQIVNLST